MCQPSPRDKSCHPACLQSLFPDFTPSYRTIPSVYGWGFPFFSSLALSHLLFQKSFLQPQASLPSFPTLSHHWRCWPTWAPGQSHTAVTLLPFSEPECSWVSFLEGAYYFCFCFCFFLASFCCGERPLHIIQRLWYFTPNILKAATFYPANILQNQEQGVREKVEACVVPDLSSISGGAFRWPSLCKLNKWGTWE